MLSLREIKVKTVLTKSKLPEVEYAINPYIGCLHACKYCYAVFMKRFSNHEEEWGRFIDVKINAVEVLRKEIRKAKKGRIFLSSVTDAYNPLERKYELTREILKVLLEYQFPISILTKSDLIVRDIDLLKQFDDCEVGFSFMSLKDKHRKDFEPLTSSPEKRLESMKKLKEAGIKTHTFIGPIFPYLTDLEELFDMFKELEVEYVFCENLNHKSRWETVMKIIEEKYPSLVEDYKRIFLTRSNYWDIIKEEIKGLSRRCGVKAKVYFHH